MTTTHKTPAGYPVHLCNEQKLAASLVGGVRDAAGQTASAVGEFFRAPDARVSDSPYSGIMGKLRWITSRPHAMYSGAKAYGDAVRSDEFSGALGRAYNHAFMSDRLRAKHVNDYAPNMYGAGDALMDAGILSLSGAAALRMARGPYAGKRMNIPKGRLGLGLGILGLAGLYGANRATDAMAWRRSGLGDAKADGRSALPNAGGGFDDYRARSRAYQDALTRVQNKNVVPTNG